MVNGELLHRWDLTPTEAIALQKELAGQVERRTPLVSSKCELIAGADVSYNRFSPMFYAAVVVLRTSDCSVVETQYALGKSPFPYIPGLLSFREAPLVLEAFAKLNHQADALMIDGQGYAHPRRFGIACHLGLWLNLPTIGCAKSRLLGTFKTPKSKPGALAPLRDSKEVIGSVVRTKFNVQPLYVSVGHRIDLPSAVRIVLESCRGYRVPEPTRQAHLRVNELRRSASLTLDSAK
ncbi:MAG: deoxyribonuclease V [Gemmataceae bacterium]|nr:deoxyribonuclease V [Gemmataceae bacterium]